MFRSAWGLVLKLHQNLEEEKNGFLFLHRCCRSRVSTGLGAEARPCPQPRGADPDMDWAVGVGFISAVLCSLGPGREEIILQRDVNAVPPSSEAHLAVFWAWITWLERPCVPAGPTASSCTDLSGFVFSHRNVCYNVINAQKRVL